MAKLTTDWVKVAESGKTIDGRVIESSWLKDAAELYSKDKYTAVITLEHYSPEWNGNYGTVEALKAEEVNGIVSLYAKLCPSDNLRYLNRQGQKLFASIKLHSDFQGTGKAYVIQIGVTDSPASVGTQQLEFRVQPGEQVSPGIELPVFTSAPEEQSLINKIKELVFSHPVSQEKEEAMKPEEFKELKDAIIEGFSALSERNLQSFKTFEESMNKTTEVGSVESLQTELNDLKKQFSAFTEKLNKGVHSPLIYSVESTGAAKDNQITGI